MSDATHLPAARAPRDAHLFGALLMMGGVLAIPLIDLFAKGLGQGYFGPQDGPALLVIGEATPALQIGWGRFLMQVLFLAPIALLGRRRGAAAPEPVHCREAGDALVVVASRSHRDPATDEFLAGYRVAELVSAGSSLKFCRVAEGRADMYPRLGRTMEWDVAAGHAVLSAAGGTVCTLDGEALRYGKPGFDNPHFVARGL